MTFPFSRCSDSIQLLKNDPVPLLGDWNDTSITFIQEDMTSQGVYLAIQGNALIQINTTNNHTAVLTGSVGMEGFKNGIATAARFNNPTSFLQHSNTKSLFLADNGNSCIRVVDQVTWAVTTLAGSCAINIENKKKVALSGEFNSTTFISPYDLVSLKPTNKIALTDKNLLRLVDMDMKTVVTKYEAKNIQFGIPYNLRRMAADNGNLRLYVAMNINRILVFNFNFQVIKEVKLSFSFNVLGETEGLAVLSSTVLLATSGFESEVKGLFVISTANGRAHNICRSKAYSSNMQFVSCEYQTDGKYITMTSDHQLLISGHVGRLKAPHVGVEISDLNSE